MAEHHCTTGRLGPKAPGIRNHSWVPALVSVPFSPHFSIPFSPHHVILSHLNSKDPEAHLDLKASFLPPYHPASLVTSPPFFPGHNTIQSPEFLLTQVLQPPRHSAQGLRNWILNIGIWIVSVAKGLKLLENKMQAFCLSVGPESQKYQCQLRLHYGKTAFRIRRKCLGPLYSA